MKFRKVLFSLILIISMMFVTVVEATPNSYSLSKGLNINYDQSIISNSSFTGGCSGMTPVHFPVKYTTSGSYIVFCTGNRSADSAYSYTKSSFSSAAKGAGVAAIINAGVGASAKTAATPTVANQKKIFTTQLAVWKYLGESFNCTEGALSGTLLSTYNSLLSTASAAETAYNDIKNFSISLNASSLTFTLSGGTYVSQTITVSGKQIKSITPSVNKGTVEKVSNNNYVVKVPKSALTTGNNTITVTFNATSNTIYVADNYTSGNDSTYQTTTTTQFDTLSKTASKSISGTINIVSLKVTVSKRGITGTDELPGATLTVKSSSGSIVKSWKTTTTPQEVIIPAAGTYTLTEDESPEGYIKNTETITFVVKADGTVTKPDGSAAGNPIVMTNKKGSFKISKRDIAGSSELPGAELKLTYPDGSTVTWISGTTDKEFAGLKAGTYTLTEKTSPDGYIKNTESIKFVVKRDGTVANSPIVMTNKKGSFKISKRSVTGSNELPGATLTLTYPNGSTVTWRSETTAKEFAGLKEGTYTLTETLAPEGYITNTEAIKFVVKHDGTVANSPVIMRNAPKGPIYISKVDAATGEELAGATLVLKYVNGSNVETVRTWITKSTPEKFENLRAGNYVLSETKVPKGYILNNKKIEFTVDEEGNANKVLVMENVKKGSFYISKQDATTGDELPGAKLVLTDAKGKEVDSWTSSSTPHKIEALDAGTYTLTELIAPKGYVRSKEIITFKVNEDGTVDEPVIMKNKPEEIDEGPTTGIKTTLSLLIAFVAFAVAFYYYSEYKIKSK